MQQEKKLVARHDVLLNRGPRKGSSQERDIQRKRERDQPGESQEVDRKL